jgi:hypothetical protein
MVSAYFFPAGHVDGSFLLVCRPARSAAKFVWRFLDQIEEATVRFVENVEKMFAAFPEREP